MNERMEMNKKNTMRKKGISYRTHIKQVKTAIIASTLSTTLAISGIGALANQAKKLISSYKLDKQILTMVSPDSKNFNVVNKSAFIVNRSEGQYAYSTIELSKDLLNVPTEYFDLAIYNVYENMINKKSNMDALFKDLNFEAKKIKESNPELYHKIAGISSFDEYLTKNKLIDKNGNPSIEQFKLKGEADKEIYKNAMNFDLSKGKSK